MRFTDIVPKGIFLTAAVEDALSLLTEDHQKVQALFARFEALKDATDSEGMEEKQRIVAAACRELTLHTALEEELFYPAVRAAIDDADLMNEAQVEHDGAKALIEQLGRMTPEDEMFNAKFMVLSEYVKHHVKEEQWEIFPQVRRAKIDLVELGGRMAARRQELAKGGPKTEVAEGKSAPATKRRRARAPAKKPAATHRKSSSAKPVSASRRKPVKASPPRKPISAAHRKTPARRQSASAKT